MQRNASRPPAAPTVILLAKSASVPARAVQRTTRESGAGLRQQDHKRGSATSDDRSGPGHALEHSSGPSPVAPPRRLAAGRGVGRDGRCACGGRGRAAARGRAAGVPPAAGAAALLPAAAGGGTRMSAEVAAGRRDGRIAGVAGAVRGVASWCASAGTPGAAAASGIPVAAPHPRPHGQSGAGAWRGPGTTVAGRLWCAWSPGATEGGSRAAAGRAGAVWAAAAPPPPPLSLLTERCPVGERGRHACRPCACRPARTGRHTSRT